MVSNFWRRLWSWFGVNVPAAETMGAPVQAAAPMPWIVGFESVLPAVRGTMMMPTSAGYGLAASPFDTVSLGDIFGKVWKMVELRQQWAVLETARPFDGYLVLSAPGWEMRVFFENAPERVEWFALAMTSGAQASGVARPEQLLWALVLWPDGLAVVEWLKANAFRSPDFGAVV